MRSKLFNLMAKLEIQIQKRVMLKPSTPTPNHLRTLKLSSLDQTDVNNYAPILFHYSGSREFAENNIVKLQKSLADTLANNFYPLAGRFNVNDLSIHCNDQGVEYVETRVNADLAELGSEFELFDHLLPWRGNLPESTDLPPLLGIQMNLFNCGGLVLGIQISHLIVDGFTLSTFLKEWGSVSRTGTTTEQDCLPSFGPLSSLFPTTILPPLHHAFAPSSSSDIVSGKIVTRRFVIDALSIEKLKDRINAASPSTKPTRVMTVLSLIWKVLVKNSSAKHGHTRESCFLIPINVRAKSKIPSLQQALGNCCIAGIATLEANHGQKLHDFVNLLGSASGDTSSALAKASIDDMTSMIADKSREYVGKFGQKDEMDVYLCSSWCRFPWYEADFGWGKPFWVSSACRNAEVIILTDPKDGDGIEAWVSLKENDIVEFERSFPDILSSLCLEN